MKPDTLWIDAQLSPSLALWMRTQFPIEAFALRDLGLRDAEDEAIFIAAKDQHAIVMTKDADFLILLERFGVPPQIIWLTCGNTSNVKLKDVLIATFPQALALLQNGEPFVEIRSSS